MLTKTKTIRVKGQRDMHVSIPLAAYKILSDYKKVNGCTLPVAVSIAVDRYSRLVDRPEPATLGVCPATRADGDRCSHYRMPGSDTCSAHGIETCRILVVLPMELQTKIDKWASHYGVNINLMIALAIVTSLKD